MAILISVLLAALIIAVLLYPFVRGRHKGRPSSVGDSLVQLDSQRHSVYEAIRTLQLERDLDKVSEDEYQHRLQQLRLQAAAALKEEERLKEELLESDQTLEEEVRAVRRSGEKEKGYDHNKSEGL